MRRATKYPTRDPLLVRVANRAMNQHDLLDIPDFLRIPPAVRRKAWEKAPPVVSSFVPVAPATTPPADVEAFRAADEARRKAVRDAKFAKLKARKAAPIIDHDTMRWDPAKNRFVTDPYLVRVAAKGRAERLAASGVVEGPKPNLVARALQAALKARTPAAKSKAVDDLGAQVVNYTAPDGLFDPARLAKFAAANGIDHAKYAQLNNGLQRMNVVNRLRGLIGKGHKVVWPIS